MMLERIANMRSLWIAVLAAAVALGGGESFAQESADSSSNSSRYASRSSRRTRTSDLRGRQGNSPTENALRGSRERTDGLRRRNSNLSGQRGRQSGASGSSQANAKGNTPATVKAKAPAKPTGGSGGSKSSAPPVEFKLQPNPNVNILYVEEVSKNPSLNMQVVEGNKFSTRVALRNARKSKFKTLEFSLRYDPDVLEPLGIDDSTIAELLSGDARATVNTRKGIVYYRAELAESRNDDTFEIAKIQWKARGHSSNSPLVLMNTDEHPSRILSADGANILQMRDENGEVVVSERTGLLDASVAVAPGKSTSADLEESEGTLSSLILANRISEGTAEGGVTLALRPRKRSVSAGEDFLVDIVYSNPHRAELDTLRLTVKFDPRVLEVVDYDNNNWITTGVNIFDGDYHEELPFDYHIRNTAFNAAGEIRYEMGFSNRTTVPAAGTVATIRFRAKTSAPSTFIGFDLNEDTAGIPATAVSFLGFNLIGTPGQRASALFGAQVAVQ